ncbi:hypothetical protein GWI33_004311 [Rhynchophorus ferrugineus]|uniref:Phosphatidylcholine transfer protein n=1 Tax=Rhynchophorus ferrugineus TaxID=354439 RepID=A0A834IQA3_RHYFE|nr:hypothetical protein GWI33_004311 [Rhynchophorus ferrugineus]
MYARRLSQNFSSKGPNLKSVIPDQSINIEYFNFSKSTLVRRHFSKWSDQGIFKESNPEKTLKLWVRQFEFVCAQRVRRGQQMFTLYSKWWEERALKELMKRLRISCTRNGKELVMTAAGISLYNWEENRIKDQDFQDHLDDLKYIDILKEKTMCLSCENGQKSNSNTNLCKCGTGGITNKTHDNWSPFIEKDDLIVWRRPYGEGLFEYKVYGSYYDVTAEDFLNVQVDTNYRKEWDTTAIQLEIGETDAESDSDILYWEMQWPRLFVNRDYVFNRRYKVFNELKTIIIINKTTNYERFPKYPDKYRVEDYWSCMVIKPYTDVKQPGIEFSLTYFDNPGVNIPSSVTTWVAKSAMPDFLAKMRNASKKYREYCLTRGLTKACQVIQQEEKIRKEEEEKNKLDYCSNERLSLLLANVFEDIQRKANETLLQFRKSDVKHSGALLKSVDQGTLEDVPSQLVSSTIPKESNQNTSFWKYLHPLYYFT